MWGCWLAEHYKKWSRRGDKYREGITLPDFNGLSLVVSAKGNRSWHFRYY